MHFSNQIKAVMHIYSKFSSNRKKEKYSSFRCKINQPNSRLLSMKENETSSRRFYTIIWIKIKPFLLADRM